MENVEMWAENASSVPVLKSACELQGQDTDILSRSPLRFDRVPDQTRHSFWEGPGSSRSSTYDAAVPLAGSGATDGQHAPARRHAHRRRDLLIEDMKDLLGRAVIYALAVLGLLHVLGLVATA
jgi:hypothetical protein